MKKLWLAAGLIAFLSVLIVIALIENPGGPREPVYQGKRLSAWLEDLSDDQSPDMDTNYAFAIQQIGTNAVPFLIQMLHVKDSPFKKKCMELLERQDWVDFHFRYDIDRRNDAFHGLIVLGPNAEAAIPDLTLILKDGSRDDGLMAAYTLSRIGSPALPILESALKNTNEQVRFNATQGLDDMGQPSSVSNLLVTLKDPEWIVRAGAAMALRRFPDHANVIVPALVNCLGDSNWMFQATVLRTLGSFDERAKPAVPQILKLIEENKGDRDALAVLYKALSKIDPEAAAKLNAK